MSAAVRLQTELTAAVELAASLMAKAEEEKRALTADERETIDAKLAKAKELHAELDRAKAIDAMQGTVRELIAAAPVVSSAQRQTSKSFGEQVAASAIGDFIRAGHARGGSWVSPSVDILAATLTEDAASGGKLLVPQYQPGLIVPPYVAPTVSGLFAQGTTDAASIVYMVEKTYVNAAGPVPEGGDKPESTLTFDSVTDAVKKVATWLPVSEEMLADVSQITAYINNRLRQFVELAMDVQVIRGDGLAGAMVGILNRAGLAPAVTRGASELNAMAIYRQVVEIAATSFLMPDAVVLSPRAWGQCVIAQTSQGVFYGSGMFAGMQSPTLWGLPVVLTNQFTDETDGLVGAFKQGGQLWKRDQITVQASNSHADFFTKNLVAIRAEQRAALAVYRPGAFGLVENLAVVEAPAAMGGGTSAPPSIEPPHSAPTGRRR